MDNVGVVTVLSIANAGEVEKLFNYCSSFLFFHTDNILKKFITLKKFH